MSYRLTAAIAEDPGFRARVRACLLDVATDVANEAPSGTATDTVEGGQTVDASFVRAARARLAFDTLANPACAEEPFAWLIAANAQVQGGATFDTTTGALVIDESAGKADDPALNFLTSGAWDRVARWRASGRTT